MSDTPASFGGTPLNYPMAPPSQGQSPFQGLQQPPQQPQWHPQQPQWPPQQLQWPQQWQPQQPMPQPPMPQQPMPQLQSPFVGQQPEKKEPSIFSCARWGIPKKFCLYVTLAIVFIIAAIIVNFMLDKYCNESGELSVIGNIGCAFYNLVQWILSGFSWLFKQINPGKAQNL